MNEMRKLMEAVEGLGYDDDEPLTGEQGAEDYVAEDDATSTPAEFVTAMQGEIWEVEKRAGAYKAALNKQAGNGVQGADEAAEAMDRVEDSLTELRRLLHGLR